MQCASVWGVLLRVYGGLCDDTERSQQRPLGAVCHPVHRRHYSSHNAHHRPLQETQPI